MNAYLVTEKYSNRDMIDVEVFLSMDRSTLCKSLLRIADSDSEHTFITIATATGCTFKEKYASHLLASRTCTTSMIEIVYKDMSPSLATEIGKEACENKQMDIVDMMIKKYGANPNIIAIHAARSRTLSRDEVDIIHEHMNTLNCSPYPYI